MDTEWAREEFFQMKERKENFRDCHRLIKLPLMNKRLKENLRKLQEEKSSKIVWHSEPWEVRRNVLNVGGFTKFL